MADDSYRYTASPLRAGEGTSEHVDGVAILLMYLRDLLGARSIPRGRTVRPPKTPHVHFQPIRQAEEEML